MQILNTKVCVLGSGFAGMNAQLFLQRAGVKNIMVSGMCIGGQIMYTSEVNNYLCNYKTSGKDLVSLARSQLKEHKCETLIDTCTEIVTDESNIVVKCKSNTVICEYLIVATGARYRTLGIKNEEIALDKSLFTCVSCEADRVANHAVAIIGGGEKAISDALYCANICSKVYLVVRKSQFKYYGTLIEKVYQNSKIEVFFNTELYEIDEELKFKFKTNNIKNNSIKVDYSVLAIGHKPNTDRIKGLPISDSEGFLITDEKLQTSDSRIYAAGEVQDKKYKQLITAAAEGAICAMEIVQKIINE